VAARMDSQLAGAGSEQAFTDSLPSSPG